MSDNQNNTMHWILGAALLLTGVFVIISMVNMYSQADDVTTTGEVSNANPSINSAYASSSANGGSNDFTSGVTLTAGSTKAVHINGSASDDNGYGDISSIAVKVYKSTATNGSACTPDNNDCYSVAECTLSGGSGVNVNYNCNVPLQFYADATDASSASPSANWLTLITATDDDAATDTDTSVTFEVNTLLALNIPSSLDYGTRTAGTPSTSSDDIPYDLTQRGNDVATVSVSGGSLTCDTSSIPVNKQAWSLTSADFTGMTGLSGTPAATSAEVGLRTSESTDVTDTLYWGISAPAGVEGTCTGATTVTASAV